MNNAEKEAAFALLSRAADSLSEHFDSVQIFCTKHDPAESDGTLSMEQGRGNWFARYGQSREWVIKQEEGSRLECKGPA